MCRKNLFGIVHPHFKWLIVIDFWPWPCTGHKGTGCHSMHHLKLFLLPPFDCICSHRISLVLLGRQVVSSACSADCEITPGAKCLQIRVKKLLLIAKARAILSCGSSCVKRKMAFKIVDDSILQRSCFSVKSAQRALGSGM